MTKLLLATDLDRTLLPNGEQPESAEARDKFAEFVRRDDVTLAYVSGRGKALLQQAIKEYQIPVPDYAIGDVGTTIYVTHDGSWKPLQAWQEKIANDWNGKNHSDLVSLFSKIDTLELQEPDKQNTFKLSYYAPEDTDKQHLIEAMESKLQAANVHASLIWSIDEQAKTGLMDVLPATATKLHALEFLMEYLQFSREETVFCGDSGNDMPALTSGLQAVLVANARDDVKEEAKNTLLQKNLPDALYIARGDFIGMNGNYSAGILEGVAHFCNINGNA